MLVRYKVCVRHTHAHTCTRGRQSQGLRTVVPLVMCCLRPLCHIHVHTGSHLDCGTRICLYVLQHAVHGCLSNTRCAFALCIWHVQANKSKSDEFWPLIIRWCHPHTNTPTPTTPSPHHSATSSPPTHAPSTSTHLNTALVHGPLPERVVGNYLLLSPTKDRSYLSVKPVNQGITLESFNSVWQLIKSSTAAQGASLEAQKRLLDVLYLVPWPKMTERYDGTGEAVMFDLARDPVKLAVRLYQVGAIRYNTRSLSFVCRYRVSDTATYACAVLPGYASAHARCTCGCTCVCIQSTGAGRNCHCACMFCSLAAACVQASILRVLCPVGLSNMSCAQLQCPWARSKHLPRCLSCAPCRLHPS